MKNKINERKQNDSKYRRGVIGFSSILAALALAAISSVTIPHEAQAATGEKYVEIQ
jgi:hypothetical protein